MAFDNNNIDKFYDIDGLYGFIDEKEYSEVHQNLQMRLEERLVDNKQTRSIMVRDKFILSHNGRKTISLRQTFNLPVGHLITDSFGRVPIFLVLNRKKEDLSEERIESIKKAFIEVFRLEFVDFYKNRPTKVGLFNSKDLSVSCRRLDVPFFLRTLEVFNNSSFLLKKERFSLYFEKFNSKYYFANFTSDLTNLYSAVTSSNFNPHTFKDAVVDYCLKVGDLTNRNEFPVATFVANKNDSFNKQGIKQYKWLNDRRLLNWNGVFKYRKHGCFNHMVKFIKKANFYNPMGKSYIPRNHRIVLFQKSLVHFIIYKMLNSKLNKDYSGYSHYKESSLFSDLNKNFVNSEYSNIYYRMEVSVVNNDHFLIDTLADYFNQLLNNVTIFSIPVAELKVKLVNNFSFILRSERNLSKRSISSVANRIVASVLFHEFFINGGANMHYMPRQLQNVLINNEDKDLCDVFASIRSLIEHPQIQISIINNYLRANKVEEEVIKSLNYILSFHADCSSEDWFGELFFNFLKKGAQFFKFSLKDFVHLNSKKLGSGIISLHQFITDNFINPIKDYKFAEIPRVIFKTGIYLHFSSATKKQILTELVRQAQVKVERYNIKYLFVPETRYGVVLSTIAAVRKEEIPDHIINKLRQLVINNFIETSPYPTMKRKFSDDEHVILFGLSHLLVEGLPRSSKNIELDLRLPFYLYCCDEGKRITTARRTSTSSKYKERLNIKESSIDLLSSFSKDETGKSIERFIRENNIFNRSKDIDEKRLFNIIRFLSLFANRSPQATPELAHKLLENKNTETIKEEVIVARNIPDSVKKEKILINIDSSETIARNLLFTVKKQLTSGKITNFTVPGALHYLHSSNRNSEEIKLTFVKLVNEEVDLGVLVILEINRKGHEVYALTGGF